MGQKKRWLMDVAVTMMILLLVGAQVNADSRGPDRVGSVSGLVKDMADAVVAGARVWLRNAQQIIIGSAVTDDDGRFTITGVIPGQYELVVSARGFAEHRTVVRVTWPRLVHLTVTLRPESLKETVTVTAESGLIEEQRTSTQPVNVIGQTHLTQRAKAVLVQALAEEAGVQMQRTSPTIGGAHIRGLAGNKINVFVDGVRYSTAAARGGIMTFLNLVDPTHLNSVEVLRGPRSADYGSDALAGSLQLLTRSPALVSSGPELHGSWAAFFNSADAGFSLNLSTSLGTRTVGVVTNLAGRRINTLRPGGGIDSHSAVTRFLGLPSTVVHGARLPDTGFTQYGGLLNFTWAPRPRHAFSLHYQRGQQDGGKRFDQLLGGDGNLIAELRNLMLDFFYARYDTYLVGWLNHLALSYSFNAQREERVNQGGSGNPGAAIVHEYEKTQAHGVQVRADTVWRRHQLRWGGDFYHEGIRAPAYAVDPVANTVELRRPRVPDGATYRSWGLYVQEAVEVVSNRLKLVGALRYSGASYHVRADDAPIVNGRPLWPGESLTFHAVSGRGGAWVGLTDELGLAFSVSRGYRAPHVTDLGTLGLTGSGFEVAAPEAAALGGQIGSTADSNAVSLGRPVTQVKPETSLNYDLSLRYSHARVRAEFTVFINGVSGLIEKQALILPAGVVGQTLGGEPIIAQTPGGAVFVASSSSPVLVRANWGDVRLGGAEQTLDLTLTSRWSFGGVFTYVRAEDRLTGLPPNVEGGTPAPDAWLWLRYTAGRRFWIEPYVHASDRQSRLSSLALEDRRVGATRSRSSIARFFANGAVVRGLVGPGRDGRLGTADDVLLATGETLAQVQDRVLGAGVSSAPLFPAIPGYVTLNLRAGFSLSEAQQVTIDLENLTDRNYRGVSWGMDAPGRSLSIRYQLWF